MKREPNKKAMLKQNVGIDVSKDSIDMALSYLTDEHKIGMCSTRKFANTKQGFEQMQNCLSRQIKTELPVHYTMEATGVYHENLAYYLYERGYTVHIVLPNQAKKYGQSLGNKSKTDKLDAKTLAQMGIERELRQWKPISSDLLKLKQFTRERDAFVRFKTTASNQLHACRHQGKPCEETISRIEKIIDFIDGKIKEIDADIAKFVDNDKKLKTKIDYLKSIPGVGLLSAAVVVAETNGFADITSIKQLTSFAGLDVKIRDSGTLKGKTKISKCGNSHIRKVLYMPALSKKTYDKTTSQFYNRIKEKKGVGMVAVVAVERKLLGLMYTLWKKEEMFRKTE
jgi:transposase